MHDKVQPDSSLSGGPAQRPDHAQAITPVPAVHHRRATLGSPAPAHHRLEHQARLIQKHDASARFSGVFLCEASLADASGQSPLRPAHERAVRASGNSNPSPAGCARRRWGGTPPRTSRRSPRPPAPGSTVLCHTHVCEDLAATAGSAAGVARPSTGRFRPDEASTSRLFGLRPQPPAATASPKPATCPPLGQQRLASCPRRARSWRVVGVVPAPLPIPSVSWKSPSVRRKDRRQSHSRYINDSKINKTVAESLVRIWAKMGMGTVGLARIRQATSAEFGTGGNRRSEGAVESSYKGRGRGGAAAYDESLHLSGIPKEVVEIFRALDSFCLSLNPGAVERRVLKLYFAYSCGRRTFCCVRVNRGSLILWLKLKYSRLEAPPPFARDVSSIGHWGTGDLELAINAQTQLDEAKALIRQSFESRI